MSQILPAVETDIAERLRLRDWYGAARIAATAYAQTIRRHIASSVQDEQVLADLCQASWLEICRSLESYRFQASFLTWAKGIATHVVTRQHARHRKAMASLARSESELEERGQVVHGDAFDGDGLPSETGPYGRVEVIERVARICHGLSPSEQALIEQRYLEGRSLRAIGMARAAEHPAGMGSCSREHVNARAKSSRLVKKLRRLWQSDTSVQISQTLQTLSPIQRSLVELCVIERRSLSQASEQLRPIHGEADLDLLRQTLRFACTQVRRELRARGILPSEAYHARLISTSELPHGGPARSRRSTRATVPGRGSIGSIASRGPKT